MRFEEIGGESIRERTRYYIRCSVCGYMLSANDYNKLIRKANNQGWRYDRKLDKTYCMYCLMNDEE
ncbi:MAG: hypothetical protein DRP09_17300 [Candidatus Thorarchaeota archaeon]|nr:MAG: hypothetical protein DRP09_17300 [Candidatus Thorarchaeota archaeon]